MPFRRKLKTKRFSWRTPTLKVYHWRAREQQLQAPPVALVLGVRGAGILRKLVGPRDWKTSAITSHL